MAQMCRLKASCADPWLTSQVQARFGSAKAKARGRSRVCLASQLPVTHGATLFSPVLAQNGEVRQGSWRSSQAGCQVHCVGELNPVSFSPTQAQTAEAGELVLGPEAAPGEVGPGAVPGEVGGTTLQCARDESSDRRTRHAGRREPLRERNR